MPLESISCTGCGSTEVKEVKSNTYFCEHCEGVFKFIDSSRITVEERPSSCECGNLIQFYCQKCYTTGLCSECNFGESQVFGLWLDTTDLKVGFRSSAGSSESSAEVLSINSKKLRSHQHECTSCLKERAREIVGLLASGELCMDSQCQTRSYSRCRCCNGAYCKECLGEKLYPSLCFVRLERGSLRSVDGDLIEIGDDHLGLITHGSYKYRDFDEGNSYPIFRPRDLCVHCAKHYRSRYLELRAQYHPDLEIGYCLETFHVPRTDRLPRGMTKKRQKADRDRMEATARLIAETCASDINARLEVLVGTTPCQCQRPYEVVDRRGSA
jgi:hypothetical protein